MGRLDEKIAIITGVNSGMGMATAKALAEEARKNSGSMIRIPERGYFILGV